MVRIRFHNKDDAANGYYQLFTHGVVRSLPNFTYEVSEELLKALDQANIPYEIVKAEASDAAEQVRNPLTVSL